jgi:8-oxo-dGTP pyrophosphatase MutT (NUDIX family)
MKTSPWWFYKQSAAVPYRAGSDGIEVLLITSRGRKRWIVPKGVIDLGKTAGEAALNEAFEEAGVRGQISANPVGEYSYEKWGGTCNVKIFLLEVETVLDEWPEQNDRSREWMTIERAAERLREEELKRVVLSIPGSLSKSNLL